MSHTATSLKLVQTRLTESEDMLTKMYNKSQHTHNQVATSRILTQLTKIQTILLDYEFRLKQFKK